MLSITRPLAAGLIVEEFFKSLKERGVESYFGVPGRQFKGLSTSAPSYVKQNIVATNEGAALCMAAGYYMGTGSIPCVYLSNSGIGNIINPLLSLTHRTADSIPALLLIDWRGAPGKDDFPQHDNTGRHTENLLAVLGQPFSIFGPGDSPQVSWELILDKAFSHFYQNRSPFVVLTESNALEVGEPATSITTANLMSRRDAVEHVLHCIPEDDILVTSSCGVSKDAVAARIKAQVKKRRDHISIGTREHTSSLAEGIALATPLKNIFCLEFGFHAFPENFTISPPKNLKRVIFRTKEQESILSLAQSLRYTSVGVVRTLEEIQCGIEKMKMDSPSVLEILVSIDGQGEEVIKYNAKTIMNFLKNDKELEKN